MINMSTETQTAESSGKIELPEMKKRIIIPAASSVYPTIGNSFKNPEYKINYSQKLVKTGKNYYDSKEQLPAGYRLSTASEERALQRAIEETGKDPRKAKIFDDLFARNKEKWYAWQWTETGLRVPKAYKSDKHEKDEQGRKYWPRIVLIGNEKVGEVLVPEGSGRVIVEWDEVFGIPRVTENIVWFHKGYNTHFWFNSSPSKDSKSGYYDVAVARWDAWLPGGLERCLAVGARSVRWAAGSRDGFRPVQGSLPEIEKEIAKINPKNVEDALLERMRTDFRKMPFAEFQEKYNL